MTTVLVLAALLVLAGYGHAIARCRREVRARRAAARRRADAARVIELAAHRWDAHTARLTAALEPLLTDDAVATATGGFGDAIVAEERIRFAVASLNPPALLEDRQP